MRNDHDQQFLILRNWSNTVLERVLHLPRQLAQPALNLRGDPDLLPQRDDLSLQRVHRDNVLLLGVEVDAVDAGEELLEVRLDDGRFCGLAQDLEEVVVADEVKAGETGPLFFQELVEALLASLQSVEHVGEDALDRTDPEERNDPVVSLDVPHDHPKVVVYLAEHLPIVKALKSNQRKIRAFQTGMYV